MIKFKLFGLKEHQQKLKKLSIATTTNGKTTKPISHQRSQLSI